MPCHLRLIWQQTSNPQQRAKYKHVDKYEWRIKNSTIGLEDIDLLWEFTVARVDAAFKINKKLDQEYPRVCQLRCDR